MKKDVSMIVSIIIMVCFTVSFFAFVFTGWMLNEWVLGFLCLVPAIVFAIEGFVQRLSWKYVFAGVWLVVSLIYLL